MKILLFGANGQVGWELRRSLAPLGELIALGSAGEEGLAGNFLDPQAVAATVEKVRPTVVVNAAAYTAVDRAESEPDAARMVNALTPEAIAQSARRIGAPVVHYSTDYVFDGSGEQPWREDDVTGPLSVYGRTKLEGEQRIAAAQPQHLILRTSWVYAARGGNFAKTMVRLARERERLTVIDDQFGAPTGAELLADVTAHAIPALLRDPALAGIYHVAAEGVTTWNGYARFVVDQARQLGESLKAGPADVAPVPTSAFPTPARRPHNSRLDTGRFRRAFGLALPPWERGVARMLQEILERS
ncbi:MAG TPA: dTDP-4-dehydrorhamnose reductase [Ramlibacter sp.]|uniref:dTDP-4-dehydrorhamnose reductase n=1 Tax=Ramlibacter sp. TaxID=1917967 RepID=UPI002D804217|nr:dTDP-4-dehydrorhamnose reductase [Ramlibacter sp.]HET8744030.1 dTDP-4-dehydrorhamnose reductase [Ramlibacter sp.]